MITKAKNPQIGGLFEDWLKEEVLRPEISTGPTKRVVAWQLEQAMQEGKLSKSAMAKRVGDLTLTQLNRLLDADNGNVTLDALAKAAAAVGRRVRLELV